MSGVCDTPYYENPEAIVEKIFISSIGNVYV
jgi:hypothetical protein